MNTFKVTLLYSEEEVKAKEFFTRDSFVLFLDAEGDTVAMYRADEVKSVKRTN